MAPELFIKDTCASYSSDIYGLGCLLYAMTNGKTPFYSRDLSELKLDIQSEQLPNLNPDKYSIDFNDIVKKML